jgi:hypothetical protein
MEITSFEFDGHVWDVTANGRVYWGGSSDDEPDTLDAAQEHYDSVLTEPDSDDWDDKWYDERDG